MLSLALLAASSLFSGVFAENTIMGEVYIEGNCRGEALVQVSNPNQCTEAINGASIEVSSISQYCELRGYTDSGCSQGEVTIIALQGYTGCFTYLQDDVSYLEVFCTQQNGPLANNTESAVEARSTDLVVRERGTVGQHQKRFALALGLAIFKISNYAFSALGIYSSCTGAGGSSISAASCVWGVISTLVTAGMDIKNLYNTLGTGLQFVMTVKQALNEFNGPEHSFLEEYSHNMSAKMQAGSAMQYKHHGFLSANHTKHGHLVPDFASKWPIMEVTNPHGAKYHHLVVPMNGSVFHRMGPAPQLTARQSYNGEYFTAGAMDSYACLSSDDLDHQLTEDDFNGVLDFVECGVPDTQGTSDIEYQMYDNSIQGTLGSGSIAGANPNGQTHITSDSQCPSGLAEANCATENF